MDSDQVKIFVGGISLETTQEKLRDHFSAFGEVMEVVIMKDRATGRGRGFGFIIFAEPAISDMVFQQKHNIDGRMVSIGTGIRVFEYVFVLYA
jgi:RNA-binding protein Musashi